MSLNSSPYTSLLQSSSSELYVYKYKNEGIAEKAKETSSDTCMHNRAITVLHVHEQWMCPGMQRHTHITLCSMVTINFVSVLPYSPSPQASNQLNTDYPSKKSHYYNYYVYISVGMGRI